MERHSNGEQEHRRGGSRDAGRRFRDQDEQDFTERSFAQPQQHGWRDDELDEPRRGRGDEGWDRGRVRGFEEQRFPEDRRWRTAGERRDDRDMDRFEPEYRRAGGDAYGGRDYEGGGYRQSGQRDYERGGYGQSGQRDYERGGYGQGGQRDYERGGYGQGGQRDFDRGYGQGDVGRDETFARGRYSQGGQADFGRTGGSRGELGRDEESYPDAPGTRGYYGGHHSAEGWREQRGWGRDIARDLDADSDPYGGRFAGRGPKSYQRGDERIREDVCDRLTQDVEVDPSEITVSVQNGEVTLEGAVENRRAKRRAEDCADSVSGVRQVHNRLTVQSQGHSQGPRHDDRGAAQFRWGGERGWRGWDPEAHRGGFATREHGMGQRRQPADGSYGGREPHERQGTRGATASGATDIRRMREEQRGSWLGEEPGRFGSVGPKNYQRSNDRIREDVCDRLTEDDGVDATNITVTVKDGEVTLEGTVDDRSMKRRAEDCADDVSGVRQVHNRLVVQPQHQATGTESATSIGTSAGTGSTAATGAGGTGSAAGGTATGTGRSGKSS